MAPITGALLAELPSSNIFFKIAKFDKKKPPYRRDGRGLNFEVFEKCLLNIKVESTIETEAYPLKGHSMKNH